MNGTKSADMKKNCWVLACALLAFPAMAMIWPRHASAEIQRYWCPDRVGAEIQAQPGSGCEPLIVEEDENDKEIREKRPPLSLDEIEATADAFLQKYKRFLACCATDFDAGNEIEDLEDEASAILKQLSLLPPIVFLGKSQGLIAPLARARNRLHALKDQHADLAELYYEVPFLDYESAGQQRLTIQQREEEITNDFRSSTPPDSAPTGSRIGNSTLNNAAQTGSQLGGSIFNQSASSGTQIGNSTVNALATTGTPEGGSTLNDSATVDAAIGASSPINKDARAGPDVGNSSLNATSSSGPVIDNSSLNQP